MTKQRIKTVGLVPQQVGIVRRGPSDVERLREILKVNGQYLVTVHNKHITEVLRVEKLDNGAGEKSDLFVEAWGITLQAAAALRAAGFEEIATVEGADDAALLAVEGVGEAMVRRIRGRGNF